MIFDLHFHAIIIWEILFEKKLGWICFDQYWIRRCRQFFPINMNDGQLPTVIVSTAHGNPVMDYPSKIHFVFDEVVFGCVFFNRNERNGFSTSR